MKKLINQVESVLEEQLQGLAEAHPELLVHEDPAFVTRADAPVVGKVAILSGGGSGHEPMHCGFVGEGCSTAPVRAKFSPRRRRIKCTSAAGRSTAAPGCCC